MLCWNCDRGERPGRRSRPRYRRRRRSRCRSSCSTSAKHVEHTADNASGRKPFALLWTWTSRATRDAAVDCSLGIVRVVLSALPFARFEGGGGRRRGWLIIRDRDSFRAGLWACGHGGSTSGMFSSWCWCWSLGWRMCWRVGWGYRRSSCCFRDRRRFGYGGGAETSRQVEGWRRGRRRRRRGREFVALVLFFPPKPHARALLLLLDDCFGRGYLGQLDLLRCRLDGLADKVWNGRGCG